MPSIINDGKITVQGVGPKDAEIIFVGEAPGKLEETTGKPFVGPAGDLLNQVLMAVGINKSECYITNVIKERPPTTSRKSNDITTFVDITKKVPIETEAYKKYLLELKEELMGVKATTIVAFGNVPLYALTGIHPPKITKRRGSIYPCTLVPGKKVIASIHPAACIQRGPTKSGETGGMWIWRYFIFYDLKRAMEESKFIEIQELKYDINITPTFLECTQFLNLIIPGTICAFDIEVINLEVSHISFAIKGKAISIPFVMKGIDYMTAHQELEIWKMIGKILYDDTIKKLGQNLIFDTQFIFRKYGLITRNIDDTMVAQGVIFPDFPKGLDFIASVYTDIPYYKDEGKKYFKLPSADEAFAMYNAKDSITCLEAFHKQVNELKRLGSMDRYKAQARIIQPLVYMSERGIKLDLIGMKKMSDKLNSRIEELSDRLNIICGYEINYNSPKQLMTYFYGKMGYKPLVKKGQQTTDVDALKRLAIRGAPEATILLEIRRIHKLKSTYLDANIDDDGRLRCAFNPVGTVSGRISSSKTIWGTGMNIQNDPPEFKQFMLFDDGYVGYDLDLSQAENRIVAVIAPDAKMIAAFEDGIDIHKKTAAGIFGKPIEEITSEIGECPICKDPKTCGHKGERFWGKKSNHSFNYGLGPFQFAYRLGVSNIVGKRIRDAYHNTYPGIKRYWLWIQEELGRNNKILVNLYGTHRMFMDRWGDSLFKSAYSWIPQGTVADKINTEGLIEIFYNQQTYREAELLNQVHDSIVLQIPISAGWKRHAEILLHAVESLERELTWKGRKFVVPTNISMGKNFDGFHKVKRMPTVDSLAVELQNTWKGIPDNE